MFVVNVYLNDALRTEVEHGLAGIPTPEIENDLFVLIRFGILSQVIVIFDAIPNHTDRRKVLQTDFVRNRNESNINSPVN